MGLFILIVFFAAMALSVPIGIALGIAALSGLMFISFDPELIILLPQKFMAGLDSFPMLAIPLFILAGAIMSRGGIARRIVDLALVFFGRIRGGLGIVVTVSTFFFGAICGSGSAKTAAIGSVMFPEMKRKGYPPDLATAIIASAGGGPRPSSPLPSISSSSALSQTYRSGGCSRQASFPRSSVWSPWLSWFILRPKSLTFPWARRFPEGRSLRSSETGFPPCSWS